MDYQIGNIVMLKKGHPRGTNERQIIRVGPGFKLNCRGCNRIVIEPRKAFEKSVKKTISE